jgi:hypothetical protein
VEKLNLKNIVLFYLTKLLEGVDDEMSITLQQLQTDLTIINSLMDDISSVYSTPVENTIVNFLEIADSDPLVQNIILYVINNAPASTTTTNKEVK